MISSPAPAVISAYGISKQYRDRAIRALVSRAEAACGRVALQPVDLFVKRGSSLGIIGCNGAGKSTLLRILAGVARPTTGRVDVEGISRSLLDLGAGMFDEMTGRENARMLLALDGLDGARLERACRAALDFSGLHSFADAPLRTYSSGMRVRLAYALAVAVPCDLLVADEVLAVGDEEFQRRCSHHIRDFLAAGGTLVLASHNLYQIEKLCGEAIWLERGGIQARGPARAVTAAYRSWIEASDRASGPSDAPTGGSGLAEESPPRLGAGALGGATVRLRIEAQGQESPRLAEGDSFRVTFSPGLPVGSRVEICRGGGFCVLEVPVAGDSLQIGVTPLLPGRYHCRVVYPDGSAPRVTGRAEFDCVGSSRDLGFVRLRHRWQEVRHA